MKKTLRIGTRGSPLALIQAEMAKAALRRGSPEALADMEIELVPIRTSGDWRPEMAERTLEQAGANKGLFTKEIDEALIAGYIDVAVHSVKDMATILPRPLDLAGVLERADPRDAFLSASRARFTELPAGATVGTASLRRAAQILAKRPDLKVVPLRGNVDTRLKKLADGVADATVLAVAGLHRLGLESRLTDILETDVMLPAVGQGAVGLVVHGANQAVVDLVQAANHRPTHLAVLAERALLRILDGSCRTPIAALARLASDQVLLLEGLVARPDGTGLVRLHRSGSTADPEKIGEELGRAIRAAAPADCFAAADS